MKSPVSEAERFGYRPKPFYYITTTDPSKLSYESFYLSFVRMKNEGYGGIVLFNRPPEGFSREQYLGEGWFDMVSNALAAAKSVGLTVWINDSYDAPPGDAGGRIQRIAPELCGRRIRPDGENGVRVEEVSWGFPSYLESESSRLFIEIVYEEYKARFSEYFGNTLYGIFSDADARQVNSGILFAGSPMKDYYPWSIGFAQSFEEKFGYDIMPHMPDIVRGRENIHTCDYWRHASDLYFTWFENNYRWCRENGLKYTYHTSDNTPYVLCERHPYSCVFSQGRISDSYRHCDFPGTDHEMLDLNSARVINDPSETEIPETSWCGDDSRRRPSNFYEVKKDLRAKQAESACFLNRRDGVMCEMYAAVTWSATHCDLRKISTWQIMQGVNFIVHQSYHHRLSGVTKDFAPYSFSDYTPYMRELNDMQSEYACLADMGTLDVSLAVLDISEAVWAGTTDSEALTEICCLLNRMPQGYVISDIDGIERNRDRLRAVVNPGIVLSEPDRNRLNSIGLPVLNASAEEIAAAVPENLTYTGDGKPHFMRRRLDDGSVMWLCANVEDEKEIGGRLEIGSVGYDIALASGEIAFFADDFQLYRSFPSDDAIKIALPESCDISWEAPNCIPLECFFGESGRTISKTGRAVDEHFLIASGSMKNRPNRNQTSESSDLLNFPFEITQPLSELYIYIPQSALTAVQTLLFDGNPIDCPCRRTSVFDDSYLSYDLRRRASTGRHTVSIKLNSPIPASSRLYLFGDFDADIVTENDFYIPSSWAAGAQYLPEAMSVRLSPRRQSISTRKSWVEQGQPMYSGSAEYSFSVTLPDGIKKAQLHLDGLSDVCEVYADGCYLGTIAYEPYELPLTLGGGSHSFRLRVTNTLGNMLEAYKAPSGIVGGYIRCQ